MKIPPVGIWREKSDTMFLTIANSQAFPTTLAANVLAYRMEKYVGVKSRSGARGQLPGGGGGGEIGGSGLGIGDWGQGAGSQLREDGRLRPAPIVAAH